MKRPVTSDSGSIGSRGLDPFPDSRSEAVSRDDHFGASESRPCIWFFREEHCSSEIRKVFREEQIV